MFLFDIYLRADFICLINNTFYISYYNQSAYMYLYMFALTNIKCFIIRPRAKMQQNLLFCKHELDGRRNFFLAWPHNIVYVYRVWRTTYNKLRFLNSSATTSFALLKFLFIIINLIISWLFRT